MDRWSGKVAVITGASSGIGLATAKALVRHGLIVVGLARRRSKMEVFIVELPVYIYSDSKIYTCNKICSHAIINHKIFLE